MTWTFLKTTEQEVIENGRWINSKMYFELQTILWQEDNPFSEILVLVDTVMSIFANFSDNTVSFQIKNITAWLSNSSDDFSSILWSIIIFLDFLTADDNYSCFQHCQLECLGRATCWSGCVTWAVWLSPCLASDVPEAQEWHELTSVDRLTRGRLLGLSSCPILPEQSHRLKSGQEEQ